MKSSQEEEVNTKEWTPLKRHKTDNDVASSDGESSAVWIDLDLRYSPERGSPASKAGLRESLKNRFYLASQFLPFVSLEADDYEDVCAYRTAETLVKVCRVLELSYAVTLTGLVYLQMYKNSSKRWREIAHNDSGDETSPRKMGCRDQLLIAGACILLAWKYREDGIGGSKSSRKIFELSSALYKIYAVQSKKCSGVPSVSGWMLQDEGNEINKLKTQIIEHESHLLQSLDYHIGPIPLPHKLIPAYVRKFLIATAGDISDLQEVAERMDDLVGVLVLDCYKTQICLDYTPGDILSACIFKAACLLSVAGIYTAIFSPDTPDRKFTDHATDMESRLNKFFSFIGHSVTTTDRILHCLWDIRRYSKLFKEDDKGEHSPS